ncbi:MAG: DUF58 domain-containing protein [Gemmatimonadota bacterium]
MGVESASLRQRLGRLVPDTARAVAAFRSAFGGAASGQELTDPHEFALHVRKLELHTRHLVDTLFSGEYQSVFRGQGLEFSHIREYQHGDDVRSIDWNVTARRGEPYVKQFVEERELAVMLVVDMSASEEFGTGQGANRDVALELAAVLALSAARNNDQVGLVIVTDEVELYIPPGSGRRHALRLLLELRGFTPRSRGTKLSVALDFISRICKHRTIVFLISDFLLDSEEVGALRAVGGGVSDRHDLVAIRLTDSSTGELPEVGMIALVDPERGQRLLVDAGDASLRANFRSDEADARKEVSTLLRDLSVDKIEVDPHESYIEPLLAFFHRRERTSR